MMTKPIAMALCVFVLTLLFSLTASAGGQGNDKGQASDDPFILPLKTIHEVLSKVDGSRCPMHPSCSAYGFEAIRTHGLVKGWMMTCDRLIRCGRDELQLSPYVIVHGSVCCHDPVPGPHASH